MDISYWTWLGTIYLIYLTYQDHKNNRMVDDRKNSFMLGLSLSLVSHVKSTLFYKLALTVVLIILYSILKKLKPIGEADINTIAWMFLGFGLINPMYLVWYFGTFSIITLAYYVIKVTVSKLLKTDSKQPTPFYIVFLISFILCSLILRIY